MCWFKKNKTFDDIVSESFYEEGRWVEESINIWTDTKTGAKLFTGRSGQVVINDVPVSIQIHTAFWNMKIKPIMQEKQRKENELRRLYDTTNS